MAHMDLHGGNVLVKKDSSGKYHKYVYMDLTGAFKTVYIPVLYDVKIIDLDGAHKFKADQSVAEVFRDPIKNEHVFTGDPIKKTNPRINTMKILFTFSRYFSNRETKHLITSTFVNNKRETPFFSKNFSKMNAELLRSIDLKMINEYGIFIKRNGSGVNMQDDFIMKPTYIVDLLARQYTYIPDEKNVVKTFSQFALYKTRVHPSPIRPANDILNNLKKEVKDICGKPQRGKPTLNCSKAIAKLKETCKNTPGHLYKSRECVVRKRAKRKAPPVKQKSPFVSPKTTSVLNNELKMLKNEVQVICGIRKKGRPTIKCSIVITQLKERCKQLPNRMYEKRECRMKKKVGRPKKSK